MSRYNMVECRQIMERAREVLPHGSNLGLEAGIALEQLLRAAMEMVEDLEKFVSGGFESMGDFAVSVVKASETGVEDPRLSPLRLDRYEGELAAVVLQAAADLDRLELLEAWLHARSSHPYYEYVARDYNCEIDWDHWLRRSTPEGEGWCLNTSSGDKGVVRVPTRCGTISRVVWRRRRKPGDEVK